MQIVAGSSSPELAQEISEITGCELVTPLMKEFPDGEQYIRFPEELGNDVLIVQSLYYPQATNLFELLNMIYTLKKMGVSTVRVFTPYLCYARSDRAVLKGEAIGIFTVLHLLESVGLDHLFVIDIHNPKVLEKSSLPVTNIFPIEAIKDYFDNLQININDFQIVAPDAGAKERASIYAKTLGLQYTWLNKVRDPQSGEISLDLGDADINSTKIILIDDIMASGASLEHAASLLKLFDVTEIYVFVAHALGTSAVDRIREMGEGDVIATNSIPTIIGRLSPAKDLVKYL